MTTAILNKAVYFSSFIKFSHTVFALPFAMSMVVLCSSYASIEWSQLLWILVALIAARSSAMAFNRIVDREIDAKNERTKMRELPSGTLSYLEAVLFWGIATALFVFSAAMLGKHCLFLSPIVLLVLLGYSYLKRFTAAVHLFLGLALALAPGGVWYALTAEWSLLPVPMMLGVLLWVAGFDILYSCQDEAFDQSLGLYSVPSVFGVEIGFRLSKSLHLSSIICFIVSGIVFQQGVYYYLGLLFFSLILLRQHRLVSPDDLTKIDAAFFTQNGVASIVFFLSVLADQIF